MNAFTWGWRRKAGRPPDPPERGFWGRKTRAADLQIDARGVQIIAAGAFLKKRLRASLPDVQGVEVNCQVPCVPLDRTKSMMVLYSGTTCPFSQRCRLVLFEKGMDFEIKDVDLFKKPEDINVMNPYGQVPILVERDLTLYESNIINEYIDERFPHPQLMPADPVMRARARLFLFNFERELFVHVQTIENTNNQKAIEKGKLLVRDRLTQLAPILLKSKYMLGDEFSMLDVAIAPLLWRLDHYGIDLPKSAAPLMKYAERIFSRPAYIEALTPSEKVMRR
jgi:RNA polymerase-associated protein